MNRYRLHHFTEFQYDGPVSESFNEVRLRPVHDERQSCISFRLSTEPHSRALAHRDYFGNWVHQLNVAPEHRHLTIETESVVLVHNAPPVPGDSISLFEFEGMRESVYEDNYEYLAPTSYVPHLPEVAELMDAARERSQGTVAGFVQAAADLVHHKFRYEKGATHVHSSIQDALRLKAGVCQDFAHLLLAVVRMRGMPGRYVSGYLVPRSTAEPGAGVEQVIGGQASHAWTEVYLPGSGWISYDPTLGAPVSLRHVRIAYGRDYGDVPPVRGVYKGHAGQRLHVDVRVRPALDDEGHEQLMETAAGPADVSQEQRLHQPQQQQQQQQ
jgi:transglutaminase-like putative cysteine protease